MNKHAKYISYLARHKWYVMVECFRVGLYWRGIIHDLSKFRPCEWIPYANYFGDRPPIDPKKGYYKPTTTGDDAFDFAWLQHQKLNDHHWQWWILPEDNGGVKILPMSKVAGQEMMCDWIGASKAQGRGGMSSVAEWYEENKHKMQLHRNTSIWIESQFFDHERKSRK